MVGRTRLISAPAARGQSAHGNWKQVMGSMGALTSEGVDTSVNQTTEKFEAAVVPDEDWARTVAMREAAEGIQRLAQTTQPPHAASYSEVDAELNKLPMARRSLSADLSSLPAKFALEIEHKGDRWKVTAPGVHSGLWKSGEDLPSVVEEALAVLAEMMRLDGPTPAAKRGRRIK